MNTISITRGDSDSFTVEILDEDTKLPITLTGGKMFFTVKPLNSATNDDTDALISKSVSCDTTSATILLLPADTNLAPKTYEYDFQFVNSAGAVVHSSPTCDFVITIDTTRRIT